MVEFEFGVGDIVHCYCTKQREDNKPTRDNIYRCSVLKQNPKGTYEIEFEDGEMYRHQHGTWMFRPPKFAYKEGEMLMGMRYDIRDMMDDEKANQLSVRPLLNHPCVVRHCNPDGSYRVEFLNQVLPYHDHFCEQWLRPLTGM